MENRKHISSRLLSAYLLLISGTCMAFAGFCVPPVGEISHSVLWYVSQSLIYAGSVFGVSAYVDTRIKKITDEQTRNNAKSNS